MARIGFLGLGTMGRGMADNLVKAGHDVTVWNRSAVPEVAGAATAGSVADAAEGADFVLSCFADDTAVREVVLAEGGLAGLVDPSTIVVDLSTISPEASDEERAAFDARGVRFLDAPVFGSKGEAAAGGLWVVVGGDAEVFAEARPVLEAISETVHHIGPGGSGARMKLVGNLIVASQLLALGQALTLAEKGGLDLHKVLEVLAVTDFKSPIFDGVGPSVLAGDYSPSFALALMQKDAGLIQAYADSVGAPVPGVATARHYIDEAMAAGFGGENASALIKAIAAEADVDLTRR
ncbi:MULTISPECIES: NAD(P)-dependent oxidoreductase [unclassified Rathayibacter]|uniref:NAD(P)-dependent oxidoreductase n=1 Tax=unclassified Rathayibacter TaxID=2609250 RepID=UPI000CE8995D|nr:MULTISPECIES: NAD(P)-dependent oxidoreductase [unclassified Rathayibacter]PPF37980.1 NAD(P)-dependent oxidoreductase [Rathayibacter sp. AY1A3]PPI40831.1 NAD(P)-dependent oxidoreductase [Rathayibacter sp. RFBD1]PPI60833.1 NAD(P)-dependent oxidoreductase [Rathayibacter sp. TRS19]